MDVRKTIVGWEARACLQKCQADDKIDGNIAKNWKHIDREAFAEVMDLDSGRFRSFRCATHSADLLTDVFRGSY